MSSAAAPTRTRRSGSVPRLRSRCSPPISNARQPPAPVEVGAGSPFNSQEETMNRVTALALAMLTITAALPAAAQESGGLRLRNNPLATLDLIDCTRGCPH